jgi:hypothetical protein
MRQWAQDNVGIGPEQKWTEEDWNEIIKEYDRQVAEDPTKKDLTMERLFIRFGKDWQGPTKGPAGKHNTTADNPSDNVDDYINSVRV